MFHSGIATHQIKLKATLLQIYWNKYLFRKRVYNPGEVIEVQSSSKKDSMVCLRTDLDKVNTQIRDLYDIIETLKENVEKIGRK